MRPYVKPELYCETFELSQHIAACGIDVNFAKVTEADCQPKLDPEFWGGMNDAVFNSSEGCSMDIGVIEVYCYTTGTTEAGKLFNS